MTNELLQLDREWLTNLCSNGVSFLRELLKIFHEQGDAYLRLLTSCNTLGGHPELSDQTHRLKGSAMEKEIKAGEQAVEQYIAEIENTK